MLIAYILYPLYNKNEKNKKSCLKKKKNGIKTLYIEVRGYFLLRKDGPMDNENYDVSNLNSDYFFHYLLHHCEEVRNTLVEHLSNHPITHTFLENSDYYESTDISKKRVLDIVVSDNEGYYYDIEMQNGSIGRSEMMRFFNYAALLLEKQIKKGGTYNVKTVKTLIIYTGPPIHSFHHFLHHLELVDFNYSIKLKDGPIEIEILQTQKMEELSMDIIERNKFNRLIHLFSKKGKLEDNQKDELTSKVFKIYQEYLNSEEYLHYIQIERDRRVYNTGLENSKNEGIQEGISIGKEQGFALGKEQGFELGKEQGFALGKEQGISIGKEQGKKDSSLEYASLLISRQYKNESLDWLNDCSLEQLAYIFKLDLNNYSFKEFKNLILHYKKSED